jgi:hypothetical protein
MGLTGTSLDGDETAAEGRDRTEPLRLSRLKLAGPPTPRDTEASNASAVMHDALGPVCMCNLIGINSIIDSQDDEVKNAGCL